MTKRFVSMSIHNFSENLNNDIYSKPCLLINLTIRVFHLIRVEHLSFFLPLFLTLPPDQPPATLIIASTFSLPNTFPSSVKETIRNAMVNHDTLLAFRNSNFKNFVLKKMSIGLTQRNKAFF